MNPDIEAPETEEEDDFLTRPMSEERVIHITLLNLQMQRRDFECKPFADAKRQQDLIDYLNQQIDALGRAMKLIHKYRKLTEALAVLKDA